MPTCDVICRVEMKGLFLLMKACLAIVLLVLVCGCMAPQAKQEKKLDPVFFPPAPDPPRIQFLLSIGNSLDVEGREVETSLFAVKPVENRRARSLLKPFGVALHGDLIYVADSLIGRVAVINLREKSFEWLKGDERGGKLQKPLNLTTDAEGNLYVADVGRNRILVYDAAGNFTSIIGDGYDIEPVDVAVDERHVYVLDRNSSQILVLRKRDGELVEGLGQGRENLYENLWLPTTMTLSDRGVFYVANAGTGMIIQIDRDGNFLSSLGKMGDRPGQFARPRGVALDSDGRLYVVDAGHQNVQMFNKDNRLLMHFGDPGVSRGYLNVPAGIAVSNENLDLYQQYAEPNFKLEQVIFVISQIQPFHLNIYGLGKKTDFDYEGYYRKTEELRQQEAGDAGTEDGK